MLTVEQKINIAAQMQLQKEKDKYVCELNLKMLTALQDASGVAREEQRLSQINTALAALSEEITSLESQM